MQTDRYQLFGYIGKGSQGVVHLAKDVLKGELVAVKLFDRAWCKNHFKYILREVLHHQQLSLYRYPHIVEFRRVFLTPQYLGVAMEYVDGTNLEQYLECQGGRLPEPTARYILQQLVLAVDFCHSKGKVNRDIKPANILVRETKYTDRPIVKLCDFGFSKDVEGESEPITQLGTALFTAPEIFTGQGKAYNGRAADVWSLGVVLFTMLFGSHPFLNAEHCQLSKAEQVVVLIENILKSNWQVQQADASKYPGAIDLISRMLSLYPEHRLTLSGVMSHPWFMTDLPHGIGHFYYVYNELDVKKIPPSEQNAAQIREIISAAAAAAPGDYEVLESCSSASSEDKAVVLHALSLDSQQEVNRLHAQERQPSYDAVTSSAPRSTQSHTAQSSHCCSHAPIASGCGSQGVPQGPFAGLPQIMEDMEPCVLNTAGKMYTSTTSGAPERGSCCETSNQPGWPSPYETIQPAGSQSLSHNSKYLDVGTVSLDGSPPLSNDCSVNNASLYASHSCEAASQNTAHDFQDCPAEEQSSLQTPLHQGRQEKDMSVIYDSSFFYKLQLPLVLAQANLMAAEHQGSLASN